jgi:hypothetical protein
MYKICQKCEQEYYIDSEDNIELCHECYNKACEVFKRYKKEFYKTHDKNSELPVCFAEFCNNDFMEDLYETKNN